MIPIGSGLFSLLSFVLMNVFVGSEFRNRFHKAHVHSCWTETQD